MHGQMFCFIRFVHLTLTKVIVVLIICTVSYYTVTNLYAFVACKLDLLAFLSD